MECVGKGYATALGRDRSSREGQKWLQVCKKQEEKKGGRDETEAWEGKTRTNSMEERSSSGSSRSAKAKRRGTKTGPLQKSPSEFAAREERKERRRERVRMMPLHQPIWRLLENTLPAAISSQLRQCCMMVLHGPSQEPPPNSNSQY